MFSGRILYIVAIFLFLISCSPIQQIEKSELSDSSLASQKSEYYIDMNEDGVFEQIELDVDHKPKPIQGEHQFNQVLGKGIRYPARARERGIQGTVILEIHVNKSGQVTTLTIKRGVSDDLDHEALKAFKKASAQGYWPLIIDDKPVSFKMNYPIKFSL